MAKGITNKKSIQRTKVNKNVGIKKLNWYNGNTKKRPVQFPYTFGLQQDWTWSDRIEKLSLVGVPKNGDDLGKIVHKRLIARLKGATMSTGTCVLSNVGPILQHYGMWSWIARGLSDPAKMPFFWTPIIWSPHTWEGNIIVTMIFRWFSDDFQMIFRWFLYVFHNHHHYYDFRIIFRQF